MEADVRPVNDRPRSVQSDARYAEGVHFLQAGNWKEAIASFQAVLQENPHDEAARSALEEAELKSSLQRNVHVRAKRLTFSVRAVFVRFLLLLGAVALVVLVLRVVNEQVMPIIRLFLFEQHVHRLEREATSLLEAGRADASATKLDSAEATFQQLLALNPGNEIAQDGLKQVAAERNLIDLYSRAVALRMAGDNAGALELFTKLQLLRSPYLDVADQIAQIRASLDTSELFAAAEADYQAGRLSEALVKFQEVYHRDVSYQTSLVEERLYDINMQLGTQLIDKEPPAAENVSQALTYFEAALQLRPRDPAATRERQIGQAFLDGQGRFQAGDWMGAITFLRGLVDQRPAYLRGLAAEQLYDAYIDDGDARLAAGDCPGAYRQFEAAADLPVRETATAVARKSETRACLTPTPTATPTPTPTPIPTSTPIPPPTATPTPIPWWSLRGQIVFRSDDKKQPGLWVMDPAGKNRRYLGDAYEEQYAATYAQQAYSPDGQYRAWAETKDNVVQILVSQPSTSQFPNPPPRQLTHLSRTCYDPVWSPDGGRIAFVSEDKGSDDIWVISVDGTNAKNLTPNTWEWEKHPSWSPDSQRLVFWSNRNGIQQIYVMNADGTGLTNISNSKGNEYDPLWIK